MDIEEIYTFLTESQGIKRKDLNLTADLCNDLGIEGDDYFELEEDFEKRFHVDMSNYRWYFHHGEEGWNIGALFSSAPYQQVKHIPVTPQVLLEAAKTRSWPIKYPTHTIKSRKLEMAINKLVVAILLGIVVMSIINEIETVDKTV